jgi:hypothetical protein
MTKVLCIHERDLSGMAAVWAAHRALGDDVEFVAAERGGMPPDCLPHAHVGAEPIGLNCAPLRGRDILILGDLYPLDVLRAMAREARSVLVIAGQGASEFLLSSVAPTLANYKTWFADDPAEWPGGKLASAVDLSRTTTAIAWDYLHPGQPRPRIVELVNGLTADHTHLSHRDEVLLQFHEAYPVPTVKQIIEWAERHPQFAEDIRAHAAVSRDWAAKGGMTADEPTKIELDRAFNRAIDVMMSKPHQAQDDDARRFAAVAGSYGFEATKESLTRWDDWFAYSSRLDGDPAHEPFRKNWQTLLYGGTAILRDRARLVAAIVARRRTMRIGGHVVPVVGCPAALADEVGGALCAICPNCGGEAFRSEGEDEFGTNELRPFDRYCCYKCSEWQETDDVFAAAYYDGPDRRHFTLCSPEGGADCGEIARRVAEQLNADVAREIMREYGTAFFNGFAASGTTRSAQFDAPPGWNGE